MNELIFHKPNKNKGAFTNELPTITGNDRRTIYSVKS